MTVIAYDGRTLAADSLATRGGERILSAVPKIFFENGLVFACAGASNMSRPLIEWAKAGRKIEGLPKGDSADKPGWSMWVIDPLRPYEFELFQTEGGPHPTLVAPPYTAGCGADYAMGAMFAGKGPTEAVAIACKLDVHCGLPIWTLSMAECALAVHDPALRVVPDLREWSNGFREAAE